MYVVNWFIGWSMGAVLTYDNKRFVLMDGLELARVYVLHGKFLMDMTSSLPFFVDVRRELCTAQFCEDCHMDGSRNALMSLSCLPSQEPCRVLRGLPPSWQDGAVRIVEPLVGVFALCRLQQRPRASPRRRSGS